jgi:hypothetical protein
MKSMIESAPPGGSPDGNDVPPGYRLSPGVDRLTNPLQTRSTVAEPVNFHFFTIHHSANRSGED